VALRPRSRVVRFAGQAGWLQRCKRAIELAVTYVLASFPSGFGLARLLLDENEPIVLPIALALGPVVAPFRIGKALRDLRRLGRLAALARSPA